MKNVFHRYVGEEDGAGVQHELAEGDRGRGALCRADRAVLRRQHGRLQEGQGRARARQVQEVLLRRRARFQVRT